MDRSFLERLSGQLSELRREGVYKQERILESPQQARVRVAGDGAREVLNFCANNYLGLANSPAVLAAAHAALEEFGYGMASVRFICGTQSVHMALEERIARFLGTEETILYSSCFDANGGLFEALLDERDAVISDALNHASIIDGIRLCKARRLRYANGDMRELEARLEESRDARVRLIATDGVFSMDGTVARLADICRLAERHRALVMVDDSHATGVLGAGGRGSPEHCGVGEQIDIYTGTLGKALGGASGGYVSGRREIVSWLRQKSRPYLFSNSLAPMIAAVSVAVLDALEADAGPRSRLLGHARYFRDGLRKLGYAVAQGIHPIVPIMIGDAAQANALADGLLDLGIYVVGFSYPVVPKGAARIRVQLSAAHSRDDLDAALAAFGRAGHELGLLGAPP